MPLTLPQLERHLFAAADWAASKVLELFVRLVGLLTAPVGARLCAVGRVPARMLGIGLRRVGMSDPQVDGSDPLGDVAAVASKRQGLGLELHTPWVSCVVRYIGGFERFLPCGGRAPA